MRVRLNLTFLAILNFKCDVLVKSDAEECYCSNESFSPPSGGKKLGSWKEVVAAIAIAIVSRAAFHLERVCGRDVALLI